MPFRPDQIEDDALRFVEIPKLRNGAVNLQWSGSDLYGLLFARLALTPDEEARRAFGRLLGENGFTLPDSNAVLTRRPTATPFSLAGGRWVWSSTIRS